MNRLHDLIRLTIGQVEVWMGDVQAGVLPTAASLTISRAELKAALKLADGPKTKDALLERLDGTAADCKRLFGEGSDVHRAAQLLYTVTLKAIEESERGGLSDQEEYRAAWACKMRQEAAAMRKYINV